MITEDLINGTEFVKFVQDSTPEVESKYGLKFEKGHKREIKTICNYIKNIPECFLIKRLNWNNFKLFDVNNNLIMECTLADDKYVSDDYNNTDYEEHQRLYKVKDISELIDYLKYMSNNIKEVEDFSVKDWVIEQNLLPHEILHRRILQVIEYCKYKNITDIHQDKKLKSYITDYLQLILRQTIKDPSNFNYIIGLRISRYLRQDQFINFNVQLKILIGLLKQGEKFTYDRFIKLHEEYNKFENSLLDYINGRLN